MGWRAGGAVLHRGSTLVRPPYLAVWRMPFRALSRLPAFTRSRIPALLWRRAAALDRRGLLCAKCRDTTSHPRPLTRSLTDKHVKMTPNTLFSRVYSSVNLTGRAGGWGLAPGTSDKAVRVWRRSRHSEMRLGRVSRGATMPEGLGSRQRTVPGGNPRPPARVTGRVAFNTFIDG